MRERRCIQKTVRMSKTVYNFIIKQNGGNFDKKFENAILNFMKQEIFKSNND